MKLVDEWKQVVRRAWSMRLMVLAAILSGAEIVIPMYADSLPRGLFAVLSMVSVTGAFVARILAQKGLTNGTDK
jgi:hypothetical protein